MTLKSTVVALVFVTALAACDSAEDKAEKHFASAVDLYESGDVERALVELRNVFQNDEGHKEAHLLFAGIQQDRGRFRQSIRSYLRVAEEFPEEYEAVVALAELAAFMQSWDEAERHGRAAQELNPEHLDTRAIKAVLDYRQALLDRDDVARTDLIEAAKDLLVEKPDSLILRNVLIDGFNWQRDFEAALEQVDASIEQRPRHKAFYFTKLTILAEIGDEALIEEHLVTMSTLFPNDDDIKTTMIRFLLTTGDRDGAEEFFRGIADPASNEIGPYVAFIRFLSETRGPDVAVAEIEGDLDVTSEPVLLRSIRAGLLFDSGKRSDAISSLEAVIEEGHTQTDSGDLRVGLARMLLATGNEVGARRRVEQVLTDNSRDVDALKMQATWLIEGDKADEAINTMRIALGERADDVDALTILASAYDRNGNKELARDTLAQAVSVSGNAPGPALRYARLLVFEDRLRPAEQVLVAALRGAPTNLGILGALGEIYLSMQDFGRAAGVRARLERIGTPEASALEQTLRVRLLAAQEKNAELMETLETFANAEGANVNATIALIRARLQGGETGTALKLAEDAYSEDPDNPVLRTTLAATRAATGDVDGALAEYREMIAEGVADANIHRLLINVLLQDNQIDAAVAELDDALAAFPEDPELLWMRASYLEEQEDMDGAIEVYERLYALNTGSAVIANNLASMLATWRSDDPESVERAFTIAKRLRGTDVPAFQDTYGWILQLRGDSEEALDYLEPAAEQLSADPIVQYHLGVAYLSTGRSDDAAQQFRKAIDIAGPDASQPQIQSAQVELERLESLPAEQSTGQE